MRTSPRRLAATAAALGLALTACGTDGDPAASTTAAEGDTDPTEVAIDDFRFAPETVTVPVGTTVTWSNADATAHTVTAGSEDAPEPDRFDLEVDEPGQTVRTTFDEAGSYAYYCELHPFMVGTVEVSG